MSYSIFGENDLLTPNDPGLIFRTINFVEGVKVLHMHKSHVDATYSVGLDAFFGENDHLTPLTPNDPG